MGNEQENARTSESALNALLADYSTGICDDGTCFLKNGQPMTIDEMLGELRGGDIARQKAIRQNHLIGILSQLWIASLREEVADGVKVIDVLFEENPLLMKSLTQLFIES